MTHKGRASCNAGQWHQGWRAQWAGQRYRDTMVHGPHQSQSEMSRCHSHEQTVKLGHEQSFPASVEVDVRTSPEMNLKKSHVGSGGQYDIFRDAAWPLIRAGV